MSHAATPVSRFIGCDVGKTAIVVFEATSGRTRSIANEPQALSDFASRLDPTCFVVCEATGGYEGDLLGRLARRRRSRLTAPTPARSRPSSARSERSAKPTPSTPGRWPDTPATAALNWRAGKPATATACACRLSS